MNTENKNIEHKIMDDCKMDTLLTVYEWCILERCKHSDAQERIDNLYLGWGSFEMRNKFAQANLLDGLDVLWEICSRKTDIAGLLGIDCFDFDFVPIVMQWYFTHEFSGLHDQLDWNYNTTRKMLGYFYDMIATNKVER